MQGAEEGSTPGTNSELDLYTIPSYSSWFCWDDIHDIERRHHSEFFNNSSLSKNPRVYKQYRDFIINKYREDPPRRLAFSDVRKSLIGDVCTLHKVFLFLDSWGLINFGISAAPSSGEDPAEEKDGEEGIVKVEEGPPNGIRVVEYPGSTKTIGAVARASVGGCGGDSAAGFRLPPLTSYSDVFGETPKRAVCGNCRDECASGCYESAKGNSIICIKCFKSGNFGKDNVAEDYHLEDPKDQIVKTGSVIWTDSETMLLLEAIVKYGDDWNLVSQHVQTKSTLDCISCVIQLPFGEHLLGPRGHRDDSRNLSNLTNNVQPMEASESEAVKNEDENNEQNDDETSGSRPQKRRCLTSVSGDGTSLMKQIAFLSTAMGPEVASAAAGAAVTELCNEMPYARKVFDLEDYDGSERVVMVGDSEARNLEDSDQVGGAPKKASAPSTLQLRAAIATAFGAAAGHAKLQADQEEREIEQLIAIVIETQMKKLQYKLKYFEEVELLMKVEYEQIQKMKESIVSERINVLREVFRAGISRWKDTSSTKHSTPSPGNIML